MNNKELKKLKNYNRHKFLIEQYFDGRVEGYEIKNVGNWTLVKQFNTDRWEVAIWERKVFNDIQNLRQKNLF